MVAERYRELFTKKLYNSKRKFRAVPSTYFFVEKAQTQLESIFPTIARHRAVISRTLSRNNLFTATNDGDRITASLDYTFSSSIGSGRWSDGTYPILYTANDVDTCKAERAHYVESGVHLEVVVYDIYFSGTLADFRPTIAAGKFVLPLPHDECRPIGRMIRAERSGSSPRFDGIAAPSVRRRNGSCCSLFYRANVTSGSEVIVARI